MAVYENLPAYKAAYDLLLEIYKMNVNLTKEYRYTIGERLKNELTELLVSIYKANIAEDTKVEHLSRAREHIVVVKLTMRIMRDLNQITDKRFVALCEKTENLSKQITAWHKSTLQKTTQFNQ